MEINCEKLVKARKRKKLTIREAAKYLGIPPIYLVCMETGHRTFIFDSEIANDLLKFYGVNFSDVM